MFSLSDNRVTIGEVQAALSAAFPALRDDALLRNFFRKMYDYDYLYFRGDPRHG